MIIRCVSVFESTLKVYNTDIINNNGLFREGNGGPLNNPTKLRFAGDPYLFCGVIEKSFQKQYLQTHSKTKNLKIHLKKVAINSHGVPLIAPQNFVLQGTHACIFGESSIKSLDFAVANQNPLCVFGFEDLTLTAGYNNLPVGYA